MTVRSERGEYRTETTGDGFYEFRGLPAGRYQLSSARRDERQRLRSTTLAHVWQSETVLVEIGDGAHVDGLQFTVCKAPAW